MKRLLPDLRADDEITLEHCFILIDELGKAFDTIEGTDGHFTGIAEHVNPHVMKQYFDSQFPAFAFIRMFHHPLGKGVLVGMFMEHLNQIIGMKGFGDEE
jgi:hypothetical protein